MNNNLFIRQATVDDLDIISAVEAECFPPAEAASREQFKERLEHYASHFYLAFDGDRLVSFIDGFCTNERDLTDEMFARADMHDESGEWQMLFGVNTIPCYRRRGIAGSLIRRMTEDAREQGRRGLVLTCKEEKLHFYGELGFVKEGISSSEHGGAVWYQMRLEF